MGSGIQESRPGHSLESLFTFLILARRALLPQIRFGMRIAVQHSALCSFPGRAEITLALVLSCSTRSLRAPIDGTERDGAGRTRSSTQTTPRSATHSAIAGPVGAPRNRGGPEGYRTRVRRRPFYITRLGPEQE